MKSEPGAAAGLKQEIGAKRGFVPADGDRPQGDAGARGKMPALVKFAVIRQVNLWHDAEQPAAMNNERTVVELTLGPERGADRDHRKPVAARGDQAVDFALDRVEQRVLEQQIVDRIGRETEFGEYHQRHPRRVALGEEGKHGVGVAPRLANRNPRHAGADPGELVSVGRKKRGHRRRYARGRRIHCIWAVDRVGGRGGVLVTRPSRAKAAPE